MTINSSSSIFRTNFILSYRVYGLSSIKISGQQKSLLPGQLNTLIVSLSYLELQKSKLFKVYYGISINDA